MHLSKGCTVIVILLMMAAGCSTKSSAPPDLSLSYEMVAQNAAQYKGKRVRWYGQFAKGQVKDKAIGKGSALDAVFVDPTTDLRVTLRAFAIEAESPKDNISFMSDVQGKPCWVTGTIAGTRKEKITVGPPPVEKEVEIPLLLDAQFEQEQGSQSQFKGGELSKGEDSATKPVREPIGKRPTTIHFDAPPSTFRSFTERVDNDDTPLTVARVSPEFFGSPLIEPMLGRNFIADEYLHHSTVLILNHRFWEVRLKSAPDVIGTRLSLGGKPYTVVGIMPPGVDTPKDVIGWLPGL